jgi:hypothetical protein
MSTRRKFITLLGGAAAWPTAAHAQQASRTPRIGFLGVSTPSGVEARLQRLRTGLRDLGYVEGQNIFIDFRWNSLARASFQCTLSDPRVPHRARSRAAHEDGRRQPARSP